jgi:drug/metabolite transporter (DMT)-like permease
VAVPARSDPAPVVGSLVVVLGAALFAWLGPLSRWAYEAGMEPLPFVAWRAGIGAVFLLAIVAATLRRGAGFVAPWRLPRGEAASLGAAAVLALLLNLSIFAAFSRITVALALLGFYTYPAMVAAVAVALGRERLTTSTVAALLLALGGMAIVVVAGIDPAVGLVVDPIGVLLGLSAAACQTVFVTISRDGYRSVPADQAMAWILAGSALGCLALGLVGGAADGLAFPVADPRVLPILLAAGTLGAGLPSLLFLAGIRLVGGTRAGVLMLLEPVVAVGLAAWLLGEALRPLQVVGGAAVLGGALLLQWATRAPAPPHETGPSSAVAGRGRFADQ